jgi:sugar/nucleoside kinase (ribokinase family)
LTNLSAPFLIDFFWDNMIQVLPYADVIFGNETEAATLGKKANWGVHMHFHLHFLFFFFIVDFLSLSPLPD